MRFLIASGVTVTILICTATIGTSIPEYGPTFTLEYNTDRQGGDSTPPRQVASLQECLETCKDDSNCKAFTFVEQKRQPPNYDNFQPLCWLKNEVLGERAANGMVTGLKQ